MICRDKFLVPLLVFLFFVSAIAFPRPAAAIAYKNIRAGTARISLGGTYRLRNEFQNNYNSKRYGEDDDNFLLSRLR